MKKPWNNWIITNKLNVNTATKSQIKDTAVDLTEKNVKKKETE